MAVDLTQQNDPLAALRAIFGGNANNGTGLDAPATGLGANMGTFQLGLSGLNSLGSLWGGFQAQRLARDQFDFTKNMANTNLANQTKSYNTALEDRIRSRAAAEGSSSADAEAYLARNRL